jgi:putative acetyltransferase
MGVEVRAERPGDQGAIHEVHRLAFGQEEEARLVDALRERGHARLSLVAVDGGPIVGHVLFSDLPIKTSEGTVPALALAPLAVIPSRQHQGVGSLLVREVVLRQ